MGTEITVVGHAAYDYIFIVERQPGRDESVYITRWKKCYGGGGANIAVGFSHLGGKSILYTVAGSDFKRYEKHLGRKGVKALLERSEKRTASAFIFNDLSTQKSYFFWGASEDMKKMKGIKSNHLHIAPCHPELAVRMAEKSKFFAFEPGQDLRKYSLEELSFMVEAAGIIFCNEREYNYMRKNLSLHGKDIIVTLGSRGSRIYSRRKTTSIKAVKARHFIDATGAGDAYKAAFWYAFLKGKDMEECCRFASVFASFVVEKMGAQNYPSHDRILKRYEKSFGEKFMQQ